MQSESMELPCLVALADLIAPDHAQLGLLSPLGHGNPGTPISVSLT